MKMSNINKFISGLLGVAMCPMMLPTAAFAADDGAASEVSSSPTELIQPFESQGADTGASSGDTLAAQSESASEAANATIGKTANEAATLAAETGEEGNEAAAAEVNGTTYPSLQAAINAAPRNAYGAGGNQRADGAYAKPVCRDGRFGPYRCRDGILPPLLRDCALACLLRAVRRNGAAVRGEWEHFAFALCGIASYVSSCSARLYVRFQHDRNHAPR